MNENPLHDFFSPRQVARVTGFSLERLEQWMDDEIVVPAYPDPAGDFAGAVYGMRDILATVVVQRLAQRGVSEIWQKDVQKILSELVTLDDLKTHSICFTGNHLQAAIAEDVPSSTRIGPASEICIALEPVVIATLRGIQQLETRLPEEIGQIVSDPYIWEGVPIIAGTRIPTFTMTDLVRAGWTTQRILWEYPRLTVADVEAALRFDTEYSAVARRRAS